jgi:hypothetical protein
MAGRDPDHDGDDAAPSPPAQRARPDDPPAVSVCGLEVGLLDVGRVVALNGYADECGRLAFVSSSFYLEWDLLMATKRVRYGRKKRTRLKSLSRTGDVERAPHAPVGPMGPPAPPFPPTFFNVKGCIAQSVEHRSHSSRMNPLPPFSGATQGRKRVGVVLCARR